MPNTKDIISDLNLIRKYSVKINDDTYRIIAKDNGIDVNSDKIIELVVLDLFLKDPDEAREACEISSVKKEKSFTEFIGGERDRDIEFDDSKIQNLILTLKDYIAEEDSSRKSVVSVRQVEKEIVMNAYIEENIKKTFAIESEEVVIHTYKPASKNVAIYDIENNKIKIHCRSNSDKLKKSLAGCFGSAIFDNNDFFYTGDEAASAYDLKVIENREDGFLCFSDSDSQNLKEVNIVEETLEFEFDGDLVLVTYCADDVEAMLPKLSNDMIDLTKAKRKSIKIKFNMDIDGRKKDVTVFINGKSKIKYDEKYREVIHFYLKKWGIENVNTGIRN